MEEAQVARSASGTTLTNPAAPSDEQKRVDLYDEPRQVTGPLGRKLRQSLKHVGEPMLQLVEPVSPNLRIRRTWFEPSLRIPAKQLIHKRTTNTLLALA